LEPGTYVPSSLTTIQHFLDDKSLPDFLWIASNTPKHKCRLSEFAKPGLSKAH
jgi:hypothetical protein